MSADDRDELLPADELSLLAYLDGELSPEDLVAFEAKMASDATLRRRVRALSAIGRFLRDDADRIYSAAKVDGLAETVMSRLEADVEGGPVAAKSDTDVTVLPALPANALPANDVADVDGLSRISDVTATSRAVRRGKSTVVIVAFASVAAVAAALLVFLSSNPMPPRDAPVATPTVPASATDTVAKVGPVKTAAPPGPPVPVPEHASTLEIDNLEIGEGASVIYTQDGASTIWLTEHPVVGHHEEPK